MKFHHTDNAPKAIGPYCQALEVDGWLYLSGQLGMDPETTELVPGGFEAQTRQVLKNIRAVLTAAGCTFADIVKCTVYLIDFANFPTINGSGAVFSGASGTQTFAGALNVTSGAVTLGTASMTSTRGGNASNQRADKLVTVSAGG